MNGKSSPVWVCTWAAPPLNAEESCLPKKIAFSGSTLRQQFRVSAGGKKIRLSFSNEYSEDLCPPDSPLCIETVRIARLLNPGNPDIDLSTDTAVTFGGSDSVSVPAGEVVTSDAVIFPTDSLCYVAVTVKFKDIPAFPACHREADCSSWAASGNHVSENFVPEEYLWSYFSLCRADVLTDSANETLVCFGDSITDGAVSTFNGFDAWPCLLSESLQKNPETSCVSVVNTAIAGNAIFGGWGVPAKDRFERDVLNIPGTKHAIILIGTNDIPGAQTDISADMIAEYSKMIRSCHERGIKIYAGTVTPFGGNSWWASELHEQIRKKINGWMSCPESGFDGLIDFSEAASDPANNSKLKAEYDSGDGLHPSVKGHAAMGAEAVAKMLKILTNR